MGKKRKAKKAAKKKAQAKKNFGGLQARLQKAAVDSKLASLANITKAEQKPKFGNTSIGMPTETNSLDKKEVKEAKKAGKITKSQKKDLLKSLRNIKRSEKAQEKSIKKDEKTIRKSMQSYFDKPELKKEWGKPLDDSAAREYGEKRRDVRQSSYSDLESKYPEEFKSAQEALNKDKRQATFLGQVADGFSRSIEQQVGVDEVTRREVGQSVDPANTIGGFVSGSTLGLSEAFKGKGKGKGVTTKGGNMYYNGQPVGSEFSTDKGAKASAQAKGAASLLGAFPAYGGIAKGVRAGISGAAAKSKFLGSVDTALKSNKLLPKLLAEVVVVNSAEEAVDAAVRLSSGQEYTPQDLLIGLGAGAVFGGGFQIKGHKFDTAQIKESLANAEAMLKKGADLSAVMDTPIGHTTLRELMQPQMGIVPPGSQALSELQGTIGKAWDTLKDKTRLASSKKEALESSAKWNKEHDFLLGLDDAIPPPPRVGKDLKSTIHPGAITKDIGGIASSFKDPFRIFESAMDSKAFKKLERILIKPFAKSKGELAGDVIKAKDDLTDLFKSNNIKPHKNSKFDKAIVALGEGRISAEDMTKKFGAEKTKFAEDAVAWARVKYDEGLKAANEAIRAINEGLPETKRMPEIEPREDYFRHGQEMNLSSLARNLFMDSSTKTKLKTKTADQVLNKQSVAKESIQKARADEGEALSFITGYMDFSESLAYLRRIKPYVPQFRALGNRFKTIARESDLDLTNLTKFTADYADQLDNTWVDPVKAAYLKYIPGGEKGLQAMDFLNNRAKFNAITTVASSLAQAGNLPGIVVKAGKHSPAGIADTFKGMVTGKDAASWSDFYRERYLGNVQNSFKKGMIDQPEKLATWALTTLDRSSVRLSLNAQLRKNLAEGMSLDEARYMADKVTRNLVGGRGIGEKSIAQSSMFGKVIAPFTLEATNAWYVLGDTVTEKQFGQLMSMLLLNHVYNKATEETGRGPVVFDPIDAMVEGYRRAKASDRNKVGNFIGPVAGEMISNLPGSALATGVAMPNSETREKAFGTRDPATFSRYGSPIPGVKTVVTAGKAISGDKDAARDLAESQALPFGGKQIGRAYDVVKGMADGEIEPTANNIIKGFIGGKYATSELEEKYGAADSPERIRLDEAIQGQDFSKNKLRSQAEKEYIKLNKLKSKSERNEAAAGFSDELKDAIEKIHEDELAGLNFLDRQTKALGVTNGKRAEFYVNELKDMTKSEREDYGKDQEEKGLMSEEIKRQIRELKGDKSFDEL